MNIQPLVLTACLSLISAGCRIQTNELVQQNITPTNTIYDWEVTGTCVGSDELYGKNVFDVYHSVKPLHQRGRGAVHHILEKTGLLPIYSLKGIRGVEPLTAELCTWLYEKYNERTGSNLPSDRCLISNEQDGDRFPDAYSFPLVFNSMEFDSRYVVILVDEAELSGSALFSLVYDLDEERLMEIDTKILNTGPHINHITYSDEKLHYLWVGYTDIEEAKTCAAKEVATFDMATGTLDVWE